MVRKREKELIHQPDILMQAYEWVTMYVRENTRQCVYGLAALGIIIAAVASWFIYANYQDRKIQYQLAQGIRAMDAYGQTRAQADIDKAEGIFQKIAGQAGGKPRYISKLYLANISMMRGKREEALKMYQEVSRNSSNDVLTRLANTAIKGIEKK
ncbi:MAG: Tetratricopeptide repeat-like domain [Deltaproteobacteria bacterium]|nr:Tetratricopeptide repeat-like domain [Deltaproteobacteria bacterium]